MKSKKVLIIAYYWPPAGGPGVQRWLKFVKYLPNFGIEPVVFVPENASYPITDDSLINDIPESLEILKLPIKEPYALAAILSKKRTGTLASGVISEERKQSFIEKVLLFVRGNLFIPDARVSWVRPSVIFLQDYIANHHIDTIVTTGPPHSLHLIGEQLKQKTKLKWVADFRDPWTTIGYHKALKLIGYANRKHEKLEKKVLNQADQIIVTSRKTQAEFQTKTDKPVTVITNGYDVYKRTSQPKDEKFTLAHIGSLLSKRNPVLLWKVLKELILEDDAFKANFKLRLAGVVSDEVIGSLEEHELLSYVEQLGYVSHTKAQELQQTARVLLLLEIDSEDTKAIIPGKLFEYMVSETPILAIGPEDSDVENLINTTNTGLYAVAGDTDGMKCLILSYFRQFQNGELKSHPIGLAQFSRKTLTKKLADLL
ncbi:glycosyltransferase family 4 protein [Paucihalobacter ruber]|uniref:Glycosyltransferase family 4 protein n=1 Tax=Paucihalobacter ruber TaxID=2567861 RepID=A0A506PEZ0_9FLAO|nr:glycosyltransferase family 4 protein [Paucihalobacter ruber]TPV32433.1 glycosyltransferase family 4 protein [Paucihalobacter ruber]